MKSIIGEELILRVHKVVHPAKITDSGAQVYKLLANYEEITNENARL